MEMKNQRKESNTSLKAGNIYMDRDLTLDNEDPSGTPSSTTTSQSEPLQASCNSQSLEEPGSSAAAPPRSVHYRRKQQKGKIWNEFTEPNAGGVVTEFPGCAEYNDSTSHVAARKKVTKTEGKNDSTCSSINSTSNILQSTEDSAVTGAEVITNSNTSKGLGSTNAANQGVAKFRAIIKCKGANDNDRRCKEIFNSYEECQKHAWDKHAIRLVACHECDGELFTKEYMKIHFRNYHNSADTSCYICDQDCTLFQNMKFHINRTHMHLFGLHEPCQPLQQIATCVESKMDELGAPTNNNVRMITTRVVKENFIVDYNVHESTPLWSFECLTKRNLENNLKKEDQRPLFHEEMSFKFEHRLSPEAVNFMGYVKGHLAAYANHRNSEANATASCSMANCMIMSSSLNNGMWCSVEKHVRLLLQKWEQVSVFCGPIFDKGSEKMKTLGVFCPRIPISYFKIIYAERKDHDPSLQVYVIPHSKETERSHFTKYRSSLDEVEKLTGSKFLHNVSCKLSWENNEKFESCPKCYKSFTTKDSLDAHLTLKCEKYKCSKCDFDCQSELTLAEHKKTHDWEIKISCNVDGCVFNTSKKSILNRHINAVHLVDRKSVRSHDGSTYRGKTMSKLEFVERNRSQNVKETEEVVKEASVKMIEVHGAMSDNKFGRKVELKVVRDKERKKELVILPSKAPANLVETIIKASQKPISFNKK